MDKLPGVGRGYQLFGARPKEPRPGAPLVVPVEPTRRTVITSLGRGLKLKISYAPEENDYFKEELKDESKDLTSSTTISTSENDESFPTEEPTVTSGRRVRFREVDDERRVRIGLTVSKEGRGKRTVSQRCKPYTPQKDLYERLARFEKAKAEWTTDSGCQTEGGRECHLPKDAVTQTKGKYVNMRDTNSIGTNVRCDHYNGEKPRVLRTVNEYYLQQLRSSQHFQQKTPFFFQHGLVNDVHIEELIACGDVSEDAFLAKMDELSGIYVGKGRENLRAVFHVMARRFEEKAEERRPWVIGRFKRWERC